MDCLIPNCPNDANADYPVCEGHTRTIHFTHRERCHCLSCAGAAEVNRVFADEDALRVDLLSELPLAA